MRKMKSREMKPLNKTFQVASRWKGVTSLRFFILHPHYSYVVNISAKERNERCALKSNNQCRFSKQFSFLNPDYLTWAPTPKPSSILSQWVMSILSLSPLPTPPLQVVVLLQILLLLYPSIITAWDHVMPYPVF